MQYFFKAKMRCFVVTSLPSSICDLPLDDNKLNDNTILTTYGGSRVGMSCIFPFIYKRAEVWSCSVLPGDILILT